MAENNNSEDWSFVALIGLVLLAICLFAETGENDISLMQAIINNLNCK